MEALGRYILSVTTAAMIVGILRALLSKNGTSALLVQLIGGLFLVFAVIEPAVHINIEKMFDIPFDFTNQADAYAEQGMETAYTQMHDIIKQQCEAYILDKALTLQTTLDVEIELSRDDGVPVPVAVRMAGNIAPYAKSSLGDWLEDSMGIPKENQIWIG